jgi:2-iminobutanoate/2-iminopropanoate deaminase
MRCQVTFLATLALLTLSVSAQSAEKKLIWPQGARTAGPYTPGILAGDTLYVSGQIGRDASGNIPSEFEAEVKQVIANAEAILKEAGMSLADVVSVQVYLTDMELFQRMNAVYTSLFKEPRPTRTTVGVAKLVGPARIEITMTAKK